MAAISSATVSIGASTKKSDYDRLVDNDKILWNKDSGMVAPFAISVRPGWLLADGSTISKTDNAEYETLVDLLKAEAGADASHPYYHADSDKTVLPDLRGYTARGITGASVSSRDKDGDRKSGDYQGDTVLNHIHQTVMGSHLHTYRNVTGGGGSQSGINFGDVVSLTLIDAAETGHINSVDLGTKNTGDPTAGGDTENVMKNVSLYYLIKF